VPPTPGKSHLSKAAGSGGPALYKTAPDVSLASASAAAEAAAGSSGGGGQGGGGGGSDNIKVVVRVRPLFPNENAKGAANVVQIAEDCSSMKVRGVGGRCVAACVSPSAGWAELGACLASTADQPRPPPVAPLLLRPTTPTPQKKP